MSKPSGKWVLSEAMRLRAGGTEEEIANIYRDAMRVEDRDHRALVDTSIALRDMGKYDYADAICHKIIGEDIYYGFAHYEYAVSCIAQGRLVEALLSLERLIERNPADLRALKLAARLAALIGDGRRATSLLDLADKADPDDTDIVWIREFCDFVGTYPSLVALRDCLEFEQNKQRYLTVDAVSDHILSALREKRGFSLIRLGDGEGAFCRISSEDERRYANLYRRNRDDRARVWFNGEIDINETGFVQQAFRLREVVKSADIVGLPYKSWITHEYNIASPTSITTLVNVLRMMRLACVDNGQSWVRQTCHAELHRSGRLSTILQHIDEIGLISSQSRAVDALKRRFDHLTIQYIPIPGEKLTDRDLGMNSEVGVHFPDRFLDVQRLLSRPLMGKLFLVAGGILGKFYCDTIKSHGGVAVDIGSLVDAWSGFDTRPGFLNASDRLT